MDSEVEARRLLSEAREDFMLAYSHALKQAKLDEQPPDLLVVPELLLSRDSEDVDEVYRRFRPDIAYAKSDGLHLVNITLDFQPGFSPVTLSRGLLRLRLEPISWYSVLFTVYGEITSLTHTHAWIEKWIDFEDAKGGNSIAGVVHEITPPEVTAGGWSFWVDFGSSDTEAFWELVASLEKDGATAVSVSSPPAAVQVNREGESSNPADRADV